MRLLHALFLIPLFGTPVLAQAAPPPAPEHQARRSATQHFADANTSHDGRLTMNQAESGYKSIAKSFAQIDVNRHGYVTMDDIKAWRAAKKAARQAARQPTGGTRPPAASDRGGSPRAMAPWPDTIMPSSLGTPRLGVDVPRTLLPGAPMS